MSKFINNASFYGSATLYSMIVGLISYPVLTRLFDVSDYGKLGLVSATIPLFVGLGKMGFQHASVRFYSEVSSAKSPWTQPQLYSTLYLSMLLSSLIVCTLIILCLPILSGWITDSSLLFELLLLASYLMIARVLESTALNLFQAKEQAAYHSAYIIIKRSVVLIATLSVLVFVEVDLKLYFATLLVVEGMLIACLLWWSAPKKDIRLRFFNTALYSSMFVYAIPMLGTEVSTSLIGVTDRYVIQALLGSESLGEFTSAYTLVEYAQAVITAALATSALPIFLRIDAEKGRLAASEFINATLRFYVIAAVPLVAFMAIAGEPILTFLAGEKYLVGAIIMPWASASLGVHGAFVLFASGLYIGKRSGKMFTLLLSTAIANVVLSLFLVPLLGIQGAAISTLLCYLVCAAVAYCYSRGVLAISLPWHSGLHALIAGACMLAVLAVYSPQQVFLNILYKGAVGALVYGCMIMLLNREFRDIVLSGAAKLPIVGDKVLAHFNMNNSA